MNIMGVDTMVAGSKMWGFAKFMFSWGWKIAMQMVTGSENKAIYMAALFLNPWGTFDLLQTLRSPDDAAGDEAPVDTEEDDGEAAEAVQEGGAFALPNPIAAAEAAKAQAAAAKDRAQDAAQAAQQAAKDKAAAAAAAAKAKVPGAIKPPKPARPPPPPEPETGRQLKLPFSLAKFIGNPLEQSSFNAATGAILVGFLLMGGLDFYAFLPESVKKNIGPGTKLIFSLVGGASVLGGGGAASMLVLPSLLKQVKSSAGELQMGGGGTEQGMPSEASKGSAAQGGVVPSLGEIARGIASPGIQPAPYPETLPKMMAGGGKRSDDGDDKEDALLFLLALASATVMGFAYGLFRVRSGSV
jgi:hypothetical protein